LRIILVKYNDDDDDDDDGIRIFELPQLN